MRKKEHRPETDKWTNQNYTRAARKASESTELKSAIAEHVMKENHLIKWDSASIIARDDIKNM